MSTSKCIGCKEQFTTIGVGNYFCQTCRDNDYKPILTEEEVIKVFEAGGLSATPITPRVVCCGTSKPVETINTDLV